MDFGTPKAFATFLNGVEARGGADTCEDVHGGLEAILNLSWQKKNRVLIHIADAPAHGSRFHDFLPSSYSSNDYYASYNDKDPRGLVMEDLIAKIKKMEIDYSFGKINNSTDAMIKEFRAIGGDNFVRCGDMAHVSTFQLAAVDMISATIESNFRSMAGALGYRGGLSAISEKSSSKTPKSYKIEKNQPAWRFVPEKKVRIGSCRVTPTDTGKFNVRYTYKDATVKMSANPFAEGSQRLSYFGIEVGRYTTFFSALTGSDATVVFKTFKHIYERTSGDGREDYLNLVEMQTISNYLTNEFNKIKNTEAKEIHFLEVRLMEVRCTSTTIRF